MPHPWRDRRKKKIPVLSKAITSAVDRTQTSDRFSVHIIKQTVDSTLNAVADCLGVPREELDVKPNVSYSTIRRHRQSNRKKVVAEAMENLCAAPGPFFLHWDGKLLADGSDSSGKYLFTQRCRYV